MSETKETRNARVQARWDELMAEGKHGHYETLFRVVREEVERERAACAELAHAIASDDAGRYAEEQATGREIAELIRARGWMASTQP